MRTTMMVISKVFFFLATKNAQLRWGFSGAEDNDDEEDEDDDEDGEDGKAKSDYFDSNF